MLKIRLTRTGRKHYHTFRLVAAESTSPRDGRFVEVLGTYNPNLANDDENKIVISDDRVKYWLGKGAQPTPKVWSLLRKRGINKAVAKEQRKVLSAASA
ncbi:30S ribosomal protein S16 [Planctomycetota bacterium]|nr:30S ribosomal protein S16 [Planctomycetota bacterium]